MKSNSTITPTTSTDNGVKKPEENATESGKLLLRLLKEGEEIEKKNTTKDSAKNKTETKIDYKGI
jgi:hypothetical protein